MQSQVRYLGVDVSKDMLVVAFERNRWQFPNSKEGYGKLVAQIQKQAGTVHVVCEATGPYHLPMCLALQQAAIPVTVANPAWIKYFGRSEGVLAKTDPIDANLIERYVNARRPAADPPIRREQIALTELVNHRAQLVDSKTALLNMRGQVLDSTVRKEIDRAIAALDRCIGAAERRLKEKIEADPNWTAKLGILTSVKGVGFTTAAVLLAKMPELGLLNRGQSAALAGLAPYDNDSGTFSGQRSICGGRSDVRRALYMAAITAARHNSVLRLFYAPDRRKEALQSRDHRRHAQAATLSQLAAQRHDRAGAASCSRTPKPAKTPPWKNTVATLAPKINASQVRLRSHSFRQ